MPGARPAGVASLGSGVSWGGGRERRTFNPLVRKQKPRKLPARSQCQSARDVALFKDRSRQGVITAPNSEFALHFGDSGAAKRRGRKASQATAAAQSPGRAPDTAAGTRPVGAGQPRRGGVTGQTARRGGARGLRGGARGTGQNRRLRREADVRGRGCGGRAGRPGCAAGAGRRQLPRLGLTKRKQLCASACSPRRRGPPKGAGVGRAKTPKGARQGRGISCLGPRTDSRVLRGCRPGGPPSPQRAPSPAPARLTHP